MPTGPNRVVSGPTPARVQRLGVPLIGLSLAAMIVALVAATTGGFVVWLAGARVSVHDPTNPLIAAVLLGTAGVWLAGAARTAAVLGPASRAVEGQEGWIVALLACGVFTGTLFGGAFVAGSADTSGYISQARLWQHGALVLRTPLADDLHLTHGQQPFVPLGYRPAPDPGAMVPTYPPGFPLMLAAAGSVGLERLVLPAAAAGLVGLTFVLGLAFGGPSAGLIAAAMAAGSPALWYQSVLPMSDVPAALWWTGSVALLMRRERWSALLAGVLAGLAALVRPNLFAMVPLLVLCQVWWESPGRDRMWRAALVLVPVAAAALGFTLYQRALYGTASETGYGDVAAFFSLAHVLPNLARYPVWLLSTHSPLLLAAVAAPFVMAGAADARAAYRGSPAMAPPRCVRAAWGGLLCFAALLAFYAVYLVFDEWTYVRFLLPMLPWLFALAGVTAAWACRRLTADLSGVAVLTLALVIAIWGVGRARGVGTFRLQASEARYVQVADFVRASPPGAVVLAMQHSGSLTYQTGRPVLRWDWIEASELETVLASLARLGRPVYAVFEDWEEPQVRARFGGTTLAELPAPVFTAGVPGGIQVRVYPLLRPAAFASAGAGGRRRP